MYLLWQDSVDKSFSICTLRFTTFHIFLFPKYKPICSQCTLSLPPQNIRKPYSFLMFSGGRERVHWEQMVYPASRGWRDFHKETFVLLLELLKGLHEKNLNQFFWAQSGPSHEFNGSFVFRGRILYLERIIRWHKEINNYR